MGSAESHHENCAIEESQEFKYKKRDYWPLINITGYRLLLDLSMIR